MIFLAPKGSELRSVALWPDGDKEQIDWTGEVIDPVAEKKKRAAEKKAKKEQQKKDKKASGSASAAASNTDCSTALGPPRTPPNNACMAMQHGNLPVATTVVHPPMAGITTAAS